MEKNHKKLLEKLPVFLRTVRGERPTKEELESLIKILKEEDKKESNTKISPTDDEVKHIKEEDMFKFVEWAASNYEFYPNLDKGWIKNGKIYIRALITEELYKVFKQKKS